VELKIAASYMLDNLADRDTRDSSSRPHAEELALALALLECGNCAASELASVVGSPRRALAALLHLHESCLAACHGQFLDAWLEGREGIGVDEALAATCLKAGGLGRFIGGFAARIATTDPAAVSLAEDLGHNAFTFVQLADDLTDACRPDGAPDDLMRGKRTVPTVLFRNNRPATLLAADACTMEPGLRFREYETSGAGLYGVALAEVFLGRAKQDVARLAEMHYRVGDLERFIESLASAHIAALDCRVEATTSASPCRGPGGRLSRRVRCAPRAVPAVHARPGAARHAT